jgi:hypothetical protein
MRPVREWHAEVDADADASYASLLESIRADAYIAIVRQDDARREVHVEGQWWFHGEWRVEPAGPARCRVTQRVLSKVEGPMRLASFLPERQGLRFAERNFQESVARMRARGGAKPNGD